MKGDKNMNSSALTIEYDDYDTNETENDLEAKVLDFDSWLDLRKEKRLTNRKRTARHKNHERRQKGYIVTNSIEDYKLWKKYSNRKVRHDRYAYKRGSYKKLLSFADMQHGTVLKGKEAKK